MGGSISHAGSTSSTATFTIRPGTKVLDDHDQEVVPGSGVAGRVAVAATNPIGLLQGPRQDGGDLPRDRRRPATPSPGDWARVEADGALMLLGRGSHCINTGGEKVFPEEVEEALKTHPAVVDALVFGIDDERWGQRIEAVVSTTRPTVDPDESHRAREGTPRRLQGAEGGPCRR